MKTEFLKSAPEYILRLGIRNFFFFWDFILKSLPVEESLLCIYQPLEKNHFSRLKVYYALKKHFKGGKKNKKKKKRVMYLLEKARIFRKSKVTDSFRPPGMLFSASSWIPKSCIGL